MTALAEAPAPAPPKEPAKPSRGSRRRKALPYMLLAPGILWLVVFFVVPMFTILTTSVETGNEDDGFALTWRWANFTDAWRLYGGQFERSLIYAVLCTVFCMVLAFPLAYFIAFKSGKWKNLLMALVIAPFFTSYLIRTLAWQTILADNGTVVRILNDLGVTNFLNWVHLTSGDKVLASPAAVLCGMVYNYLPFAALPLYSSLEKIDPRLHEAGADLYASAWTTFRKVTFPLALPGFVGGTLLTFIPATGDYVNAQMLGDPSQNVIGKKIDALLGQSLDIPGGSALSVTLMLGVLIIVMAYIKKAGTEELL